jgi:phenylalanine-4-hydroxylase
MTPTERAIAALPPHLRRYVVPQDYAAYTPRDHAVWRHVLRRLTAHLAARAHPRYLAGLAATGIDVERIPSIDEMNLRLARAGWSAVAVRGFIPPAVFTELQSRRVLAIAADVRTHQHVEYTPAPDIVHESAGHAPFVADPTYAEYLRRCGEAGFRAIASVEDQAVFEAIRNLSVVKEDPACSPDEVTLAEERLRAAAASVRYASEATRASRLYWWTAEYGLVGPLDEPRIYGAGLLSSIGEAVHCLGPDVERVPLDASCADVPYDITRMQPRLFVARDFDQLFEVLEDLVRTLSFARGGDAGLAEAARARSVNHLVLDGGREVTGRVVDRLDRLDGRPGPTGLRTALARLAGPVLASRGGAAPGRPFPGEAIVAFGEGALPARGEFDLALASGLRLRGFAVGEGEVLRLEGELAGRPLELPPWALLFLSPTLPSVGGGPADPAAWDRCSRRSPPAKGRPAPARARRRRCRPASPRSTPRCGGCARAGRRRSSGSSPCARRRSSTATTGSCARRWTSCSRRARPSGPRPRRPEAQDGRWPPCFAARAGAPPARRRARNAPSGASFTRMWNPSHSGMRRRIHSPTIGVAPSRRSSSLICSKSAMNSSCAERCRVRSG